MGRKASFIPKPDDVPKPTYLVVNADESEPGTFKDREIMFRVPHRLIEGCLITAHAIQSQNVFIYIRGEYLAEFEVLRAALDEARGTTACSRASPSCSTAARARTSAAKSQRSSSRSRASADSHARGRRSPPCPGLYAAPTLINNVETVATVPKVIELGGAEYAKIGAPPNSTGTRLFSLSGNVVRGGNYELELGTSLHDLIFEIGGGIPNGRKLKAVIPGGSSVPVLTADEVDTPLDTTR